MAGPNLTRRDALRLGAGAVAVSALGVSPAAAASFSLALPEGGAHASRTWRTTPVLKAPRRFDLVGLTWRNARIEAQVRARPNGGRWTAWFPLRALDGHAPDGERAPNGTDPAFTGAADELQFRLRGAASGLTARFVRALTDAPRARAAQVSPPALISRTEWGADSVPPRAGPTYGVVQAAFVHHTVGTNDYAPSDSAGIVLGIAHYHRDTNGWNDIGYNFLVDKYGQVFEGRAGGIDQAVVGAQAQGYNSHSTGISNLGTYESVGQSAAALDAMARLIAWKLPLHGAPLTGEVVLTSLGGADNRYASGTPVTFQRIAGHRDGDATACPGTALYNQLPELRNRAVAIAPSAPVVSAAVTMDPPATEIGYGQPLALRGVVQRGDGSPIAGQAVQVQKQGTSGWVTVARATTDGDGAWAATLDWRKAGRVRARAAVPGAAAAVVTGGAQVGMVPALAAKARTTRVRAGRTLTVDGTVRPPAPVTVVVERQGSDGLYRRVGAVVVRPRTAKFRARIGLRKPGLYRLTPKTGAGAAQARAAALYVRAVRPGASLTPPSPGGTAA